MSATPSPPVEEAPVTPPAQAALFEAAAANRESIVKPQYQNVIDLRAVLKGIQAHTPGADISPSLLSAAADPEEVTGITFIPPLNANPLVASPPAPTSALVSAAVPLPEYFNWADTEAVVNTKKWPARTEPFLAPIADQHSCGSCWAFSSVAALESRTAIWSQQPVVPLSTTFTLACVGGAQLGGDPVVPARGSAGCPVAGGGVCPVQPLLHGQGQSGCGKVRHPGGEPALR